MLSAGLFIAASVAGQFYGPYGYGRTPLPLYDPIRYARYYSGSGFYGFVPPAVLNPRVIVPFRPVTSLPGITGRVVALDERRRLITLRLPAETTQVPYGPFTQFRSANGGFPEITPGSLINVNQNMVTVLAQAQP
jgi:hypothetical protein